MESVTVYAITRHRQGRTSEVLELYAKEEDAERHLDSLTVLEPFASWEIVPWGVLQQYQGIG